MKTTSTFNIDTPHEKYCDKVVAKRLNVDEKYHIIIRSGRKSGA